MVFNANPALPTVAVVKSLREICTAAKDDDPISHLIWTPNAPADTASTENASAENASTETVSGETASHGSVGRSFEDEAIAVEMGYVADPDSHYLLVTDTEAAKDVAYVGWRHTKSRTDTEWAELHANRYRPPEINKELRDATAGACFLKRAQLLKDSEAFGD